jgi:tetratricopeptide (TPR) repeat protein
MWAEDAGPPAVRGSRDLARQRVGAALLAAAGLVVGVVLVPAGDELLLIHVRSRQLERARELADRGGQAGVSTVSSVVAHGELALFEGRVDEAVSDLESFVERNPDEPHAWRRLARLYSHAQRLQDQMRATAQLYRLEPSADTARQLVAFHRWTGDESSEAAVLHDLIDRRQASPEDHLRAARIDAARGERQRSLHALDALARADAAAIDYAAVELYVSLRGEEGSALGGLGAWVQATPVMRQHPEYFVRLASRLRERGHPAAALALVDVPPRAPVSTDLLIARAQVATGTDASNAVVDELSARDAERAFADEALEALVRLALSASRFDALGDVLARTRARASSALAAAAIGQALSQGSQVGAQALISRLGDESLRDSPLLALELAVGRGDVAAAQSWIARIDNGPVPATHEEIVAVATFEAKIGRADRAFARLAAVVASGHAPPWAYRTLVTMVSDPSTERAALAALDRQGQQHPEARRAWAALAAQAGRMDLLETWARGNADAAATPDVARDVYYLLSDAGLRESAVAAAERVAALGGGAPGRVLLGQALLAIERPAEALVPLRLVRGAGAEADAAYEVALAQAHAAGADVGEELRAAFGARLADKALADDRRTMLVEGLWAAGERAAIFPDVARFAARDIDRWLSPLVESARAAHRTEAAVEVVVDALGGQDAGDPDDHSRRETLARALIELEAPDTVLLPHLARLAAEAGGTWIHAYDERLARTTALEPRVALWTTVGASPRASRDERRAAAWKLVELGARDDAATTLWALAADAGPTDPDVLQLVSLWRDQSSTNAEEWLAARARAASPLEQPVWLGHLVTIGAARVVPAVVPSLPSEASPDFARAWLDAMRAVGDGALTRRALTDVVRAPTSDADLLRNAARTALAEGEPALAEEGFAAVLARAPADLEARRWAGTLAFYGGRTRAARHHLTAYVAGGGGEAEPLFQLAELTRASGDRTSAQQLYTRARDAVPAAATPSVLRANVLTRLGARAEAQAEFERALGADPTNRHLRADYVAALIEWTRLDDAERVLAGESSGGTDTDGSGGRRLSLLRAQIDGARGRFERARDTLDALATQQPSDPDVLVARGGVDASRGRTLEADAAYLAASQRAPEREDIARLVRERARTRAPRATASSETRTISEAWTAEVRTVSIQSGADRRMVASVSAEQQDIRAARVQRADGSLEPLADRLARVEASVTTALMPGLRTSASLFGTDGGLGVGGSATRHDLRGATTVVAEYGRPFWDFVESAADGGRRDRTTVQRDWRFTPNRALWASTGLHRYRLASGARTSSAVVTLGVVQTVRPKPPTITLQYGLDLERRLNATHVARTDGTSFAPIPLVSREVHVFGVVSRTSLRKLGEVDASSGYTVDRLGGRGSFVTARLTPPPDARVGVELWGERRRYTLATSQQAVGLGARVVVGF